MIADNQPEEFRVDPLEEDEVRAIKALMRGDASAIEQGVALRTIVNKFCRTHDLLYVADRPGASAFLNGRAFVGNQIMKVLNLPVGKLVPSQSKEGKKS